MKKYICDTCSLVAESDHDMAHKAHYVPTSAPRRSYIQQDGSTYEVVLAVLMREICGHWDLLEDHER